MRFEHESWRKLYVAESAEHRLLSVFARGLRDYLLRLAKEDGTILSSSQQPKRDLQKLLGASKREYASIDSAFDELVEIGYLSVSGGRLWITKFEEAQSARSPGAKRQAEFKARKRQRESLPEPLPDALPVTLPGNGGVTLQIDETRRDETTTAAAAVGDAEVQCPGNLELEPRQRATLESGMIPGWAITEITRNFVARHQSDPADKRTRVVWLKCLVRAISSDWNDPNKRPKKPEPELKSGMQLPKGVRFGAEGL